MADPVWLVDVLRDAGLRVWADPAWLRRGHGDMRPIVGVLCHHTAGGGSNDWRVVRDGRPGLSGPLAQMTLERNGLIRVVAAGVSWHAGTGAHRDLPGGSNWNLLGIEGVSSGRWGDWTREQIDVYPRMVAAILRHCRLPASRAVAHKEWAPRRKIDPSFDMNDFRRDVARLLAPTPTPQPTPTRLGGTVIPLQLDPTATPADWDDSATWPRREIVVCLGHVGGWRGDLILRFSPMHPGGRIFRAHVDYPAGDKVRFAGWPGAGGDKEWPGIWCSPPYQAKTQYSFRPPEGAGTLMLTYAAPGGASLNLEWER